MKHHKNIVINEHDLIVQSFSSVVAARKWIKTSGKRLHPYHKLKMYREIN